jgi:transposase
VKQRSNGPTVLLGMPEFVVGAQLEVGRELWLLVETTVEVAGCEVCGTRAVGHGRRRLKVRDLPMADRPVVLVWAKRLWRCPDPDCAVVTWSEEVDEIAPRAVLTERARAEICRLVGEAGRSVAEVAVTSGLAGTPLWRRCAIGPSPGRSFSRLGAPRALGLDEHSFLSGTVEHPTLLATGFADLDRHRLLDVVKGRTAQGVSTGWPPARRRGWPPSAPSPWIPRRLRPRAGRRAPARRTGRRPLPRGAPGQRRSR